MKFRCQALRREAGIYQSMNGLFLHQKIGCIFILKISGDPTRKDDRVALIFGLTRRPFLIKLFQQLGGDFLFPERVS
jgi:hypothetical protein